MAPKGRRVPKLDSQGSLFEDDYLLRTLGDHVRVPDVALTELVANAWDAGAAHVEVVSPEQLGELLTVADDGSGFSGKQFFERWMRLNSRSQLADLCRCGGRVL